MSGGTRGVTRLLIVSPGAKGVTDATLRKLDAAFPGYEHIEFEPRRDFRSSLTSNATVIVAGGDGTVGTVARALAGSRRRLGVLPLGTYNNFARGLAIPSRLDRAIAVVRAGATRSVTLGRINGRYFLEAAAIGIFGEAIVLGEKAKERAFGGLSRELRAVARAELFFFATSGSLDAHGRSRSLVFINTPTTGARIPIGATDPTDPFLELSIDVGASRSDIVRRVVASSVGGKHSDEDGVELSLPLTDDHHETEDRGSCRQSTRRPDTRDCRGCSPRASRDRPGMTAKATTSSRRRNRRPANAAKQTARQVRHQAKEVVTNPWVERTARLGYVVRGIIYGTMGVLALGLAFGLDLDTTDQRGSLALLGDNVVGRLFMLVVVVSLLAYAGWGLIRAIYDPLHRGDDAPGYRGADWLCLERPELRRTRTVRVRTPGRRIERWW